MKIGIDSFVAAVPDALTGENLGPADRLKLLLDEIEFAVLLRPGFDSLGSDPRFQNLPQRIGLKQRAQFWKALSGIVSVSIWSCNGQPANRGALDCIKARVSFVYAGSSRLP